jgi:hypothetical protein
VKHMHSSTDQRRALWTRILFSVSALVTVGLFFIPAFVIRPFAHQSPRALWLAMALKHWAPTLTLITCPIGVATAYRLWRSVVGWRTVFPVLAILLVVASATMAQLNYFEWMFHPVRHPEFEAAGQTKLGSGEMVLALSFNNDARAYPIREMGYHHIVNDVVGGVPVAVTY